MQLSFLAVYLTFFLTLGLAGARPVSNLEQRDECGLACAESTLLTREAPDFGVLSARAPSSSLIGPAEPTDLVERFIGLALKAAKIGAKVGKKIFGGIKKLFKKKHHKKSSAAKGAAKGGNEAHNQRQQRKNGKQKRSLELLWEEELAEREFEDAVADLYERSYEFDGDEDVFVRGYDEVFWDDLE